MAEKKFNLEYNAHSALYHCVKGAIVTKGNLSRKIVRIEQDTNNRNMEINNEKRLKENLFKEISRRYNERIGFYGLSPLGGLSDSRKSDLEIVKYNFIANGGDEDENELDYSGFYMIYPKTFICSKCDSFMSFYDKWDKFNPNKCKIDGCDGFYEQMSILLYCDECGRIKELTPNGCKEHPKQITRLKRDERDSLITWKEICPICQKQNKPPVRIFDTQVCTHYDYGLNKQISTRKAKKFIPLTVKEGGVFTPVITTCVDIPSTDHIEVDDLEYIMLGLHLGKFKKISEELDEEVTLFDIEDFSDTYNRRAVKRKKFKSKEYDGLSDEMKEKKWKEENYIDLINDVAEELKEKYEYSDLKTLNDYFALTGTFMGKNEVISYKEYIDESIKDETRKQNRIEVYESLKKQFGIENIKYMPNMTLISSCIGIINGINKFYEDGFVPHFEPIWKKKNKRKKFVAYSYPFETEGLIFDLDKVRVCNWLISNKLIDEIEVNGYDEAKEILLNIKEDTKEYEALKTLLHTLSHILINRASIYTGLDTDSCSEMIFTNQASILIYSSSNINIGGFSYIFEHYLFDWFRDIKMDISDCTFDPTCLFENGACFSCLYLPEYVCNEFNHYLDRDYYLGKRGDIISYW